MKGCAGHHPALQGAPARLLSQYNGSQQQFRTLGCGAAGWVTGCAHASMQSSTLPVLHSSLHLTTKQAQAVCEDTGMPATTVGGPDAPLPPTAALDSQMPHHTNGRSLHASQRGQSPPDWSVSLSVHTTLGKVHSQPTPATVSLGPPQMFAQPRKSADRRKHTCSKQRTELEANWPYTTGKEHAVHHTGVQLAAGPTINA